MTVQAFSGLGYMSDGVGDGGGEEIEVGLGYWFFQDGFYRTTIDKHLGGVYLGPVAALGSGNFIGFKVNNFNTGVSFKEAVNDAAHQNHFLMIIVGRLGLGINFLRRQSQGERPFPLHRLVMIAYLPAQRLSE